MKTEAQNFKHFPDSEYRFFLYDPENDFMYFKTATERDNAAYSVIRTNLDDCWAEEVKQIVAGEITHHTVRCNVELRPKREDYDNSEDWEDALGEFGGDWDYKCDYKIAPLDVKDEPVGKEAAE